MGFVARAWKDPVGSKLIAGFIGFVLVWSARHFLGASLAEAYEKAREIVQLPRWLLWLWIFATMLLVVSVSESIRRRRSLSRESDSASQVALDPKIELVTGPAAPYEVTEVQGGRVLSTVKVGVRNAGGKTLSNCKVFVEKLSPPPNAPMGDTFLLKDDFYLRYDDPEKLVEIAVHWECANTYRFSTPLPGGYFADAMFYLETGIKRTFAVRVTATECERSALFEIWADESTRLHLKFLNYIN